MADDAGFLHGPKVSRRDFLKGAGCAVGWACFSPLRAFASSGRPVGETAAVLVDLTRCIGCRSCMRACDRVNRLNAPEPALSLDRREELTFQRYTVVNREAGPDRGGAAVVRNVKSQCMHCLDPACASACPVAALYRDDAGAVLYRADRCIGCRYCMIACPFDIPKFEWNAGLAPVIGKCHFCFADRLVNGQDPGCVGACPTGALKLGSRAALLAEAHERLRAHPDKYVGHVYGENEAGGTAWLYLSDVPFEALGFKRGLPESPLPSLTWEVISRLPTFVTVLAALFGAVAAGLAREEKRP
jgi:Fe-S-cluster-containing dehydrogenase component